MECSLAKTGITRPGAYEVKCRIPGCTRVAWFPTAFPASQLAHVKAICQATLPEHGLLHRAMQWKEERDRWVKHGKPVRSEAQMAENQAICTTCEFYKPHPKDPSFGSCRICSCKLNRKESQFNKHYMGTTTCPYPLEPKWLPIVELQDG